MSTSNTDQRVQVPRHFQLFGLALGFASVFSVVLLVTSVVLVTSVDIAESSRDPRTASLILGASLWFILGPLVGWWGARHVYSVSARLKGDSAKKGHAARSAYDRALGMGTLVVVSGTFLAMTVICYVMLSTPCAMFGCSGYTPPERTEFEMIMETIRIVASFGFALCSFLAAVVFGWVAMPILAWAAPREPLPLSRYVIAAILVPCIILTVFLVLPLSAFKISDSMQTAHAPYDPSASYVYFHRDGGCALCRTGYIGRIDRNEAWRVGKLANANAAVSPDGKRIAYMAGCAGSDSGCITVSNVDGSSVRQVDKGGWFLSWSPDGCQILAAGDFTNSWGDREIFVIDRDGSNRYGVGSGRLPEWMPDGRGFVYSSGDRLLMYELETGTIRELPSEGSAGRAMQISLDGKKIAYQEGDSDLYLLDAAAGTTQLLGKVSSFAGSADLARIAINDSGEVEGYILDVASGNRVYLPIERAHHYEWSPDGKNLAIVTWAGVNPNLTVMNVEGDPRQVFSDLGASPTWSHDGKQILYENKSGIVTLMNADGTDARELYKGFSPEWIPPAREIECKITTPAQVLPPPTLLPPTPTPALPEIRIPPTAQETEALAAIAPSIANRHYSRW